MTTTPLQAGSAAPSFELASDAGAQVSLQSFAGRKLVLYFYPKDDTSGCTREAFDFHALCEAFEQADTQVVGVSPDTGASHIKFKTKYAFDLTLLSDETKQMLAAYGVWVEKSMYGRKYMGVERTTFLIDCDGRIAQVWSKVKVPNHAAEVLAASQAL